MKDLIDLLKTIFHDKAVAWLVLGGLAIPTVWVVYKFFVEGIQNATQKYYDLKLDLYKEIVKITATIATSKNKEEIDTAALQFEELYWGRLVLVEDAALESAMVAYRRLIANPSTLELETDKLVNCDLGLRNLLRNASLAVAHACFNSLQPRWSDQIHAFFRTPQKRIGG
jgi:hypothetical protein